jgi:hypothetical protein
VGWYFTSLHDSLKILGSIARLRAVWSTSPHQNFRNFMIHFVTQIPREVFTNTSSSLAYIAALRFYRVTSSSYLLSATWTHTEHEITFLVAPLAELFSYGPNFVLKIPAQTNWCSSIVFCLVSQNFLMSLTQILELG